MALGLGIGVYWATQSGPAAAIVSAFKSRVIADGGTVESPSCAKSAVKFLLDNPPPSAFDADYQAVLDRSTALGYTAPSASQQTLQNTLVEDLKTAGVWDKLDLFYVFATDGDSDFATLNWKTPSSFQTTKVNSPTFTANEGFNGGNLNYLDTNWSVANDSVNFTETNASMGFWTPGAPIANSYLMGVRIGYNDSMSVIASYATGFRLNCRATNVQDITTSNFVLFNRNGATTGSAILDGVTTDNLTGLVSDPLADLSMYICATNNNGTLFSSHPMKNSIVWAGADLTSEGSDMYDALNTYISAL